MVNPVTIFSNEGISAPNISSSSATPPPPQHMDMDIEDGRTFINSFVETRFENFYRYLKIDVNASEFPEEAEEFQTLWSILENIILNDDFLLTNQNSKHIADQFSSPIIKLKTLTILSLNLDKEDLTKRLSETRTLKCWALMEIIENLLIEDLRFIIDNDPQGLAPAGLPSNCKKFLSKFMSTFNLCILKLYNLNPTFSKQSKSNLIDRYPIFFSLEGSTPKISPVFIVQELNCNELKSNKSYLKEFIDNKCITFVKDSFNKIVSNKTQKDFEFFIELLNTNFMLVIPCDDEENSSQLERITKLINLCEEPYIFQYISKNYEKLDVSATDQLVDRYHDLLYLISTEVDEFKHPYSLELNHPYTLLDNSKVFIEFRNLDFPYVKHEFFEINDEESSKFTIFLDPKAKIKGIFNWLKTLIDTIGFDLEIPHELVFSETLKRKHNLILEKPFKKQKTSHRIDDEMSVDTLKSKNNTNHETVLKIIEDSSRVVRPFASEFKCLEILTLTGSPKQHWRPDEWQQFIANMPSKIVSVNVPIECLMSSSSSISSKIVNQRQSFTFYVSIRKSTEDRIDRSKIFNYLNQLENVIVKIDLRDGYDLYDVLAFDLGLNNKVEVNLDNVKIASDFDVVEFLEVLKGLDDNLQLEFVDILNKYFEKCFTFEQITIFMQLPGLQKYFKVKENKFHKNLERSIAELFNSDCDKGDLIFEILEMKQLYMIEKLIHRLYKWNATSPNFTKKIIACLWHLAIPMSKSSTTLSDYRKNINPSDFLWEALQSCPTLCDQFPEHISKIFTTIICTDSITNNSQGKILALFLKTESTRTLIELEMRQQTIQPLLKIMCQMEVKSDLSLYPSFVKAILNNVVNQITADAMPELLDSWQTLFVYILQRRLLTNQHYAIFIEKFNLFFETLMLDLLNPAERTKLGEYLLPIGDELIIRDDLNNQNYTRWLVSILLEHGWFTEFMSGSDIHEHIACLLIPTLKNKLPHLRKIHLDWITYILKNLDKPDLFKLIQSDKIDKIIDDVIPLIDFIVFKKMNSIPFNIVAVSQNYPKICKFILDKFMRKNNYTVNLSDLNFIPMYTDLLKTYLEHTLVSDDETINSVKHFIVLTFQRKCIPNIYIHFIRSVISLLSLKKLEKLLSELSELNKLFLNNSIHPVAGIVASHILESSEDLSEELIFRCVQIIFHRKTQKFATNFEVKNNNNFINYGTACVKLLKGANDHLCLNGPILHFFVRELMSDLKTKTDHSAMEYEDLIRRGKILIRQIFLYTRSDIKIIKSCVDLILLEDKNFITRVIKDILKNENFWSEIHFYNHDRLKFILESLPKLDEESQKYCFKLYKVNNNIFTRKFVSSQPIFYKKFVKKVYQDLASTRSEKFFCLSCAPQTVDLEFLSKYITSLEPLSSFEFYTLLKTFNINKLSSLLGREFSAEEKIIATYSKYKLCLISTANVRQFIEQSSIVSVDKSTITQISSIPLTFDEIIFDDSTLINYVSPTIFVLDDKLITTDDARQYMSDLVENVFFNKKITGAPEDEKDRREAYEGYHQYLLHIANIIIQNRPMDCSGTFLALVEIGSKCFNTYQDIPGIYHSLVEKLTHPISPLWFMQQEYEYNYNKVNNYIFKDPVKYGFITLEALKNALNQIFQGAAKGSIPFETPLNSKEAAFVYPYLYKKLNIISFLIQFYHPSLAEVILANIAHFNLKSSSELVDQVENLENKISITWFLVYMRRLKLQYDSLTRLTLETVNAELTGNQTPLMIEFKKIVTSLYGFEDDRVREVIEKLKNVVEQSANPHEEITKMRSSLKVKQPETLTDHVMIMLHEVRWKIFRDLVAELPDHLSTDVHNVKFFENELSNTINIYHAYSNQKQYKDNLIDPEAQKFLNDLKANFFERYNMISIVSEVKNYIEKSYQFTNWIKVNLPEGKSYEEVENDLLDEDYIHIKDEWIIYFLQKAGIIIPET